MLVQDIVKTAYRLAGILQAPERGISNSEGVEGLDCLNALLDSWRNEKLMVWGTLRQVYPLVPGQEAYLIGPGAADFDQVRPVKIDRASTLLLNNPPNPIEFAIAVWTVSEWQSILLKSVPSTVTLGLYYDTSNPAVGTIHFWPIPQVANDVVLYLWQVIPQFGDMGTGVEFPPGYAIAIQYGLAEELWGRSTRSVLKPEQVARLAAKAKEYKGKVKSLNMQPLYMVCDPATLSGKGGYYNFWDDTIVPR